MLKGWILFVLVIAANINLIAVSPVEKMVDGLTAYGFENVRVALDEEKCIVTLENSVYRWDVHSLVTALDFIVESIDDPVYIEIVLLEKGVPGVALTVKSEVWKRFRKNEITVAEFSKQLFITEVTSVYWEQIKNQKAVNRHTGKTDLVIYPQLAIENTLKAQLYEIQFNIAPALQLSLWKGMNFTGQVIFPLYNELGREGDFIRPGQIFVSQEFMAGRVSGKVAAGNFSSHRYGFDFSLRTVFPDENWNLNLNAGFTGSSHFIEYEWLHTPINTFTWSIGASYFVPRYNLEFEGGAQQYIYGDTGIYGRCTRWFSEVAVGFYAQWSDVNTNGGFFITFPYPFKKRNRNHRFQITIPEHQDFIYNAGTQFYYGQVYHAGPEKNQVNQFYNAGYLKNQIIKTSTR